MSLLSPFTGLKSAALEGDMLASRIMNLTRRWPVALGWTADVAVYVGIVTGFIVGQGSVRWLGIVVLAPLLTAGIMAMTGSARIGHRGPTRNQVRALSFRCVTVMLIIITNGLVRVVFIIGAVFEMATIFAMSRFWPFRRQF